MATINYLYCSSKPKSMLVVRLLFRHNNSDFVMVQIQNMKLLKNIGLKSINSMGFKLYDNKLVQIVNNRIYIREDNFYFYSLITEPKTRLELMAKDRFERDMLSQGKRLIKRLKQIDKSKNFKDERKIAYNLFSNGYLMISENGIILLEYSNLNDKLIWDFKISKREFVSNENYECLYTKFLENSIEISIFTKLIIDYLTHDFNEEGKGYLIVLIDQVEDKKNGGGTGKNLFCVLLKATINILEVSAEQIRYDSNLLQSWNGERVFIPILNLF
jgi:hypothetical protein